MKQNNFLFVTSYYYRYKKYLLREFAKSSLISTFLKFNSSSFGDAKMIFNGKSNFLNL